MLLSEMLMHAHNFRWIVHQHCRQLLLNLLVAVAAHHDHLTIARVLLASRSAQLGLGISPPTLPLVAHNFTGILPLVVVRVFAKIHATHVKGCNPCE